LCWYQIVIASLHFDTKGMVLTRVLTASVTFSVLVPLLIDTTSCKLLFEPRTNHKVFLAFHTINGISTQITQSRFMFATVVVESRETMLSEPLWT
jgi:hypothetical protein